MQRKLITIITRLPNTKIVYIFFTNNKKKKNINKWKIKKLQTFVEIYILLAKNKKYCSSSWRIKRSPIRRYTQWYCGNQEDNHDPCLVRRVASEWTQGVLRFDCLSLATVFWYSWRGYCEWQCCKCVPTCCKCEITFACFITSTCGYVQIPIGEWGPV